MLLEPLVGPAANHAVIKARMLGQNVVDYVTGRELPADKLQPREVAVVKLEPPKRGALHIAKLRHAGDWNVAPLAIPHSTTALRERRGFDVVINHREILPTDPNLVNYPLLYIHGRAAISFNDEELNALRRHLEPGGGTIFADAACASPAFDVAFRRFVTELLPNHPLAPIAPDDELYTLGVGYDLSRSNTARRPAGSTAATAQGSSSTGTGRSSTRSSTSALSGARKGSSARATHDSAMKIATNIVIYATLP